MKVQLIFIGNKFIYNESLQEYILRKVKQKFSFINSITYFKESDNSLFLYLEKEINSDGKIIIITAKHNFSTVGKVICTVTSDNQVLKDSMLIPTKVSVYDDRSYLLEHGDAQINVLQMDEMQKMPQILLQPLKDKDTIHLFEYSKDAALSVLNPLAQTFDVNVDALTLIDGWLKIEVQSNKYGNISKFIKASKEMLNENIVDASNIIVHIIDRLSKHNKKITFAESCSGGLLSYYFVKENGVSAILDGSLVTYSDFIKENWLAVETQALKDYGAVSSEVVAQMSEGALNVSDADYALSISGIAGDGGGSELKPVGTVYVSVSSKTHQSQMHLQLDGDRNYIQQQSVLFAIKMLILIDKKTFF